jgi:hypothetical protein
LRSRQLAVDLGLVPGECVGERFESRLQLLVLALRGQRLRPVQSEVEMAAPVVDLADLARGRAVEFEDFADRLVERFGENLRLGVLLGLRQVFERGAEREELAERVPAQIILVLELLDMLGRRAAGAGLEQTAARQ